MLKLNLFYSYSQKDEQYREELEKSLVMLRRYDALNDWHFRKIIPGKEWDNEIRKELEEADIVLLLISREFLSSSYCYEVEFKRALELYDQGKIAIVPIILKECDWKHEKSPIKRFEGLPKNGLPVNKWDDIDSAFYDITERLKETIEDIRRKHTIAGKDMVSSASPYTVENENTILVQALEVIQQETSKLDHNSSKEDLEKLEILKRELYQSLFSGFHEKIENIPKLREKLPEVLFDRIYISEKLDTVTIQEIQNIRDNKHLFRWYERKVIIDAITLSLISFKKFDAKKANLLIDFLTDFEAGVWESALTGLVISLVHHQNKWGRFDDLKKRLQTLQHNEVVQEGLESIEIILRHKLFTKSIFNTRIFYNSFFDSPINCFLPFYDNNKILTNAIETNSTEIDSDDFTSFITELPLLDSFKYALCLSMQDGTIAKTKLVGGKKILYNEKLRFSRLFEPYQNLICDYYNFLNHYPKNKSNNIFINQFSIAKTKLKDVILDKIHELQFAADVYIDEKNYVDAINKLLDLLKIDELDFGGNLKIAECYVKLKKPDHSSALYHLKKIENVKNNVSVLREIIECYLATNNLPSAYEYLEKAKLQHPDNKNVLIVECRYYDKKEKYEKVVDISLKGIKLYNDDYSFVFLAGNAYSSLGEHDLAIKYFLDVLDICPPEKKASTFGSLASEYAEINDPKSALKYAELGYRTDTKEWKGVTTYGRAFILAQGDMKLARHYLEKSLSIEKSAITYGNLGHLELCEGNLTKALGYYKKCIDGLKDVKAFEKKFNMDEKFLLKYEISHKQYNDIKNEIIKYYNDQKPSE